MQSEILAELHARLKVFRRLAQRERLAYTVTSTYRSLRQQERLYFGWLARGRQGIPAARPGCSTHNYGAAVDAVPRAPEDLPRMVALMAQAGLVWAGPGDRVHFGLVSFAEWRQILAEAGHVC